MTLRRGFGFHLASLCVGLLVVSPMWAYGERKLTRRAKAAAAGGCTLTIANTSMIDFWDFEDSANMGDSSAGQNTSLNEFNMSGTQTTTGALTGSNAFDVSSNSEIRTTTYATDSGFNGNTDSSDWSVCAHVHFEVDPSTGLGHIWAGSGQRVELYYESSADDLRGWVGGSSGTTNQEIIVTDWAATDEVFVCTTVDGVAAANDNVNYYVDGVVSSGSPHSTQEVVEGDRFAIGADHFGNANADETIIDSVSTFNKELSAAEVAELGGACGGKVSDA